MIKLIRTSNRFTAGDTVLLYIILSFLLFVMFLNVRDNAISSNTALIITSLVYTFVAMGMTYAQFNVRW